MDATFKVFDLHRIFIGDLPLTFLLEIVLRTLIMYAYTVFLLRILGKRGMGQLSMLELAIIISFGSAVGDPMVGADIPILHGMTAITVVTIFQISFERLINRNKKVEVVMEGTPDLVVDNGVIQWDCMKRDNISKEDLFRALRGKDVQHLGQVNKALFETSGSVSVFFNPPQKTKPGLTLLPENMIKDEEIYKNGNFSKDGTFSCCNCGNTEIFSSNEHIKECKICKAITWVEAKG